MARLTRLATFVIPLFYALIVLVAVMNIAAEGLGCAHWPVCSTGSLTAPGLDALADASRNVVNVLATLLIAATSVVLIWRFPSRPWVAWPAAVAGALLLLEIILSAAPIPAAQPLPMSAQFAIAMLIIGSVLVSVTAATVGPPLPRRGPLAPARRDSYPRLVLVTTVTMYVLLVSGAIATATAGTQACPAWPFCPVNDPYAAIQMLHRWAVAGVGVLLLYLLAATYRTRRETPLLPLAWAVAIVYLVQIAFGALDVAWQTPTATRVLHLGAGALVWGALVVMTMLAYALPTPRRAVAEAADTPQRRGIGKTIGLYVSLTKPRVISLLLVTTWAALWIASPTPPAWSLVFWTLLAGYLAAGGANAINQYMDRDIDLLMGRTARRPIPSHQIAPRNALVFGIALGVLAFLCYAVFVNVLSGVLSMIGLLFYVFIYTKWLKRTSTQNIVIGGAAGAVPPLVGWAAATGSLNLAAIFLFIIIFYWTPPHFWALALVKQKDYARAGVPMLPVIVGDHETYRQILLYSIMLVALSVMLFPMGAMGWLYLVSAIVLGGILIYYAVRLWREGGHAAAWKLYKYSLLYLALLFLAMVIDHGLSFTTLLPR
ncbi:MAG: heme o synthase [Anaerolineae bacterium]